MMAPASNKPGISRLIPLFLIIFIDSYGYFLVIPVLIRLFINNQYGLLPANADIGTRDLMYGITVMLSPFAFLIISPIFGHLSDRFGRKRMMFFSLLFSLFGYLLPILGIITQQLWLVLLGRFVAGASSSSQPVAQAAITDFTNGKQKAFFLSLIGFAMTLAMVLGPVTGGYLSDKTLVSWFSATTPYWAAVILAALNIILLRLFFHDEEQVIATGTHEPWSQRCKHLGKLLLTNKVYGLMIIFFLLEISWSQYYQSIFLFLKQHFQFNTDHIGLFTAYIGFWMSLGLTIIYRALIQYFSIEKILFYSLITASIGLLGLNDIITPMAQWGFVILLAIGVGTAYPSLLALMSNRTAKDHQGLVLGAASTVLGLAWMITAFTSGWLINFYIALPLIIAAAVMLLSLLLLPVWLKK